MGDDKLEKLKVKYGSVINKLQQSQVQLQNLHVENDKLVLRAHAKTKSAANEVWNQIKLVDSNYASDLTAQITYDSDDTSAQAKAPQPAGKDVQTYTVKKGDTLSELAQQFYGRASDYRRIFEANRDQLDDPDKIRVGQVLKIPS